MENPTKSIDSTLSSKVTRRDFIKVSASALASASLSPMLSGCGRSGGSTTAAQAATYPIDAAVSTTLQKTVKMSQIFTGTILPKNLKQIDQYDQYGYGVWRDGGPLTAVIRKDIMGSNYVSPANTSTVKLLRFFAITDIHIIDKEAPDQLFYLQQLNQYGFEATSTSVYSPTMLYTTHVLDAAIQTVNALHKQNPIDFGISLGDATNSCRRNELRWYIDIIDGNTIRPSSGAHVGEETIDYQKPYKAAGLDPAIPWYQTFGNHDHFWFGSIPVEAGGYEPGAIGDKIIATVNALAYASNIYNSTGPKYYMGVIDGTTPNGDIIKAGKVGDPGFTTAPTIVPDADRRLLPMAEWKQEFFYTSTMPIGHGFNLVPAGQDDDFGCYSFMPKSTVPLKVIVLDDTQREDDGNVTIHGRGFLDQARWAWLKAELTAGDAAGQLIIIACHVPIGVMPPAANNANHDTYMDWYDNSASPSIMQNAVTLQGLLTELHSHPNLLMWIAGHRHVNTVKAFITDDPTKPERGFWQVETCSLFNFPQQFRTFDINLNKDYTVSISAVNVDPAVAAGTPAAKARKYAVATQQIVNNQLIINLPGADPTVAGYPTALDPSTTLTNSGMDTNILSYNAQLIKQLSPEMIAKLQGLFPTI